MRFRPENSRCFAEQWNERNRTPQPGICRHSIVSGTGKAVVYATGMLTQFGRIAHLTQSLGRIASPIQIELATLTRRIVWIAVGIGALCL